MRDAGACTDGWIVTSSQPLVAFGGFVRNNGAPGGLIFWLDGDVANPIDFDGSGISGWGFFGVIAPAGFHSVEFHETEGKAEDQVIIFGDRFSFALADDPWTDLGHALAGTGGTPLLVGTGSLTEGTPVQLALTNAPGSSWSWFILGFGTMNLPFYGGTMVPTLDLVVPLLTSPAGELAVGGTWPAAVPAGIDMIFQEWIESATGPFGFVASNAVGATTP